MTYVLVAKGARVRESAGVRVLHTRRWPDDAPRHQVSRSTDSRCAVERASIDAAIRMRSPRSAVGIVAAVVQQRLALPERLSDEIDSAGRVRHRSVIRASLGDIAGGSHSLTELDFLSLCRRHGLPEPTRQMRRRGSDGRIRYLDVVWVLPDGRTVIVEIDGGLHLSERTYWADMSRDNEHNLRGDLVLRFPALALHIDEAGIVAQLRSALAPLLAA